MTGPITIQIKPGSAVVNEKLVRQFAVPANDCLPSVLRNRLGGNVTRGLTIWHEEVSGFSEGAVSC